MLKRTKRRLKTRSASSTFATAIAWVLAGILAEPSVAQVTINQGLSPFEQARASQLLPNQGGAAPFRQIAQRQLGMQHATIICGLPGDEEHREKLTKAARQLVEHGPDRLGFAREQIRLLVGDEAMLDALADLKPAGIASKETIERELSNLAAVSEATHTQWLFLLGHGNLNRKRSCFNIAGPDIDQNEFAESWHKVPGQFKIAWVTQPTSGFWVRALARTQSVTISATEVGWEITGTEMAYALGDVIENVAAHQKIADIDKDGAISLFDLFLATCLEVNGRFNAIDRVQTEHALLDDNGDGRGRELARDYLPDAPGGVLSIKNRVIPYGRDGGLARMLPITAPSETASSEQDTTPETPAASSD